MSKNILKGIGATDVASILKQAGEGDIQTLMQKNFAFWAQFSGIKVDGHDFSFDEHRYLIDIYKDQGQRVVWQKAAQLGATIYMLLRLLWMCRHMNIKAGLYFPTAEGVESLAKDRLNPLVKSNDDIYDNISDAVNTLGLKQIKNTEGQLSSLYMLYVGGRASKDSVPLDCLAFDEVRLIDPSEIDQCMERIAHSRHKYQIYMSTAGLPGNDINARFLRGSQHIWQINCVDMRERVVVRKRGTYTPEEKSLTELKDCWEEYQALSWNFRRSSWSYNDILKFHDNGVKKIVTVYFSDGSQGTFTNEHTLFKFLGDKSNRYSKESQIKDLVVGDWVLSAANVPDEGAAKGRTGPKVIPVHVPLDSDTLFVLGAFVAEGSWKNTSYTCINIAQIPGKEIRRRVILWAKNNNLKYIERSDGIDITVSCRKDLVTWFKKCGKWAKNKKFPKELLSAPKVQLQNAFIGYLNGDGHFQDRGNLAWLTTTVSKSLHEQICFIALRLGYPLRDRGGRTRKAPSSLPIFEHQIYKESPYQTIKKDLKAVQIIDIEDLDEVAAVGDLTVENHANYVLSSAGGLVVHNCGSPHTCPDGFNAAETFPECIVDTGKEVYLRCPKCKNRIYDPQYGRYVARNPGADFNSYRVSQLVSARITPKEIWEFFQTTTNIHEFYNAKLSLPYIDEDNRPVDDTVLDKATDKNMKWAYQNSTNKRELIRHGTAMGIDQGKGYCYVVIAKRSRGGKKQLVHLELIEQANKFYWKTDPETGKKKPVSPFIRCKELMKEFNVRMCIVDAMPNANEAADMAREFKGRCFVGWYKDMGKDMVSWGDRPVEKQTIRKGNESIKLNFQADISRYLSLDYTLKQWAEGVYQMPDYRMVKQVARNQSTGRFEPEAIGLRFRNHMKSLVRQTVIQDEETGKSKTQWIHVGEDHFAHAMNYCNIAIERMRAVSPFSFA